MLHDTYCRHAIENPVKLVSWWMMAAWAYDVAYEPIISDALFDEIALRIDAEWDQIEHHHKFLIDRAAVKSALAFKGERWPNIVIDAAKDLIGSDCSPPCRQPLTREQMEFVNRLTAADAVEARARLSEVGKP